MALTSSSPTLRFHGGRRSRFCCFRRFHCFFAGLAFSLALLFLQFSFGLLFYQQLHLRRKLRNHFLVFIQCLKRVEWGRCFHFRLLATVVRVRCRHRERRPEQER